MGSNYKLDYNVDIVMCIDATGSMGSLLDTVKKNALKFYGDLTSAMAEKGKYVEELRVRVIAFRDYLADGDNAMLATDFYSLPAEEKEFEQLVSSLKPFGGGDDEEDGLEALAYAIKSDWTKGPHSRHVIVVWTDDATHKLGFGRDPENGRYLVDSKTSFDQVKENARKYPTKMAKDFAELSDWWGDVERPGLMNQYAKRLLIYAPEVKYWNSISDQWDQVLHFTSEAGKGLRELDYGEIIQTIANSIANNGGQPEFE